MPAEVPGKSDILGITAVYLIVLLTLEKETNLIGDSSWDIWSFREKEAFQKGSYL